MRGERFTRCKWSRVHPRSLCWLGAAVPPPATPLTRHVRTQRDQTGRPEGNNYGEMMISFILTNFIAHPQSQSGVNFIM